MVNSFYKIAYISVLVCFCLGCNINKKNKELEPIMPFYQIKNEVLAHEIEAYIDSVKVYEPKFNIVGVSILQYYDTTIYFLHNASSAVGLIEPLTVYSKIKGNIVTFSFRTMWDIIALPDSVAWTYLKDIFPEEYGYFQNKEYVGDFLIEYIPPTGGGLEWELKFVKGQLINKKVYETQ